MRLSIRLAFNDPIEVSQIQSCKIENSEEVITVDGILNLNKEMIEVSLIKPITLKENQKFQIQLH